jgi:putative toxin-antitoxin system antitoxin component (TIGR02293 family)
MATTIDRPVRRPLKAIKAKSKVGTAKAGIRGPHAQFGGVERKAPSAVTKVYVVTYRPTRGVDDFVRQVAIAEPMVLVQTERHGVDGRFLKDLSKRMEIPATRMFDMLGVPKATAEKKSAAGELVAGSGGQAAIGVAKLIALAQELVANSTAKEASGFDAARWLGQWLDRPQPSLGGRKPAELIDTPTGVEVVARLLGAIESGAYQ